MLLIYELLLKFLIFYLLIGLCIHIVLFFLAKVRCMDEKDIGGEGWYLILNSVRGLLFFLLIGSIKWLPVTIPFLIKRNSKLSFWKNTSLIIQFIKNPNQYHRERFIRKYQ